jgi:hypothetical protein
MGTSHEDQYKFLIKFYSVPLKMINRQKRRPRKTYTLCSITFFRISYRYEIIWKNTVQPDGPQKIRRMFFTCWIPKATNTHSKYIKHLLFFHCNNGYTYATHRYVIRTLQPVVIIILTMYILVIRCLQVKES